MSTNGLTLNDFTDTDSYPMTPSFSLNLLQFMLDQHYARINSAAAHCTD